MTKIGIVGAGAGGIATALFLVKAGVPVSDIFVYESRSETDFYEEKPKGGLGLGCNGMLVLDRLGLAEIALERGHECPSFQFYHSSGEKLANFSNGRRETHGFAGMMMARATPIKILLEEAKKLSVSFQCGRKVISVEETEDWVQLTFEDNSKSDHLDLLIGADGIWSKIRRTHVVKETEKYVPKYSGLVGVGGLIKKGLVELPFKVEDQTCWMITGATGFFGMSHINPEGDIQWWSTYENPSPQPADTESIRKSLIEAHGNWFSSIPEIIEKATEMFQWPVYSVPPLPAWHTSRVVLVGDSAHAMPPHSGQGFSQALEDALYLVYFLQKHNILGGSAFSKQQIEDALKEYQYIRKPHVEAIVKDAERRGAEKRNKSRFEDWFKKHMSKFFFNYIFKDSWLDPVLKPQLPYLK
eukprot:TRINITY_DN6382_c0_g1_i1.p1 TRINITY_DN6382_c0_g1~~TRINITY_DN6382_c0_g1_i1.p1  ORF type:complete len:413 (-),score=141.93 TRINITY_DN6382_c0_g1_i1:816-2054(-)